MASNYGVIGFINPPTLSSVTKAALVQFKQEYEVYKEKCADVNKSRPVDKKILIASIRDCVDGQMLSALVKMKKIEGAATVEQATPKRVEKWFEEVLNFAPQDLSERIAAVLASVKYNKIRGDPAGSVLTYCIDVMKALSNHVAEDVLEDVDQAAKFIDKLVDKIGGACKVLRERMVMRREGWTKKEKGVFNKFERELAVLAIDVHQNEVALKRTTKLSSSNAHKEQNSGASKNKNSNGGEGSGNQNGNKQSKNSKKRKGQV